MSQITYFKDNYGVDSIKFNLWLNKNHSISIGELDTLTLKSRYVNEYKFVLEKANTPFVSDYKYCSRCNEKLLKKEFYISKVNKCGLSSACKSCTKKAITAINTAKRLKKVKKDV